MFATKAAKYKALLNEIITVNSTGRPILIGTCSIVESEKIALLLEEHNISCNVLNAKKDEYEAEIIADAGALNAVTVSTNMAGRGTDIRLGGSDESTKEKVSELGGLYVIGTNRHESVRIDDQLRGRAGRQGDPGSTRFFVSLEDDLLIKYGIEKIVKPNQYDAQSEQPINTQAIEKSILRAQKKIENQNYEIRKTLRKYSEITNDHRRIMHKTSTGVLKNDLVISEIEETEHALYEQLTHKIGIEAFREVEKAITLCCIDQSWSDYLEYTV